MQAESDSESTQKFPVAEENRVRRVPSRGSYTRADIYPILDDALVGQVGFDSENGPVVIPMLFARDGDRILLHGSTKSRLMLAIISGKKVCFSVTLLDGIVLAKSLFHHSMNYRAATCFGRGSEITGSDERMEALRLMSEKVLPSRWSDARQPHEKEMKATCIAAIEIESASAKIRNGPPIDEPDDLSLPVWSGILPMRTIAEEPVADEHTQTDVPAYMHDWRKAFNSQ